MTDQSKSHGSKHSESATDDFVEAMVVGAAKVIGLLAWWAVRFPLASMPIVLALAATAVAGWRLGVVVVVVWAVSYGLWCYLDRESFHRVVWYPIRASWLTWWRYTRSWEQVCTLHGLTARLGERTLVPRLLSVRIGGGTDALVVRIVTGQTVADWQKQGAALAETWRCSRLTVRSVRPGEVSIVVHRGDDLSQPIPLPRPGYGTRTDLVAVTVGAADGHRSWVLPMLGHHVLVAGATGSGKGSVLWSIIAGLAPAVRAGTVRLCVIDPKGGMELGRGAPLFAAFSHDHAETTLGLLRALVSVMTRRAARLRGHTRLHTPSEAEPLLVVIIDELVSLTAYGTDRKIRAEIEQLLGLLLSQGRAVGVSVIAAAQDPAKDTLPVRQLFTVRIGLRMTEATQTGMVLGAAAREAGAVCDQIPDSTPGLGYVMVDGTSEPLRVRAYHVTDADIDHLTKYFIPAHRPHLPDEPDDRRAP
ncbi:MAG TPA: FtsK/SpoIIIE domain-containing protein [Mycobacterium sp.]|nr:FtsK/SpoIIIE domain-containing protein [Mycobacterium sp.]HTY32496.1 FtsK/SpoIIIE domain-containing protein [Mycobacterium sp.]